MDFPVFRQTFLLRFQNFFINLIKKFVLNKKVPLCQTLVPAAHVPQKWVLAPAYGASCGRILS